VYQFNVAAARQGRALELEGVVSAENVAQPAVLGGRKPMPGRQLNRIVIAVVQTLLHQQYRSYNVK